MHNFSAHLLSWIVPALLPASALAAAAYYLTSRPLRREEHARFLLELIESALAQGQPVERYIVSLSHSRDSSLGPRFHLLAAYIEQGRSLAGALEKVPALAPPQLVAMLGVGESLGDYGRVLPACREMLRDGLSQSRASINYQVAFAFILNPVFIAVLAFISTKVVPVFNDIRSSLRVPQSPAHAFLLHALPWIFVLQLLLVVALYFFAVLFLGGPRFVSWLGEALTPAADWIWLRAPWRRKRLQRDFSAMLALLLDANLPEERAIMLAAEGTANAVFIGMARRAVERLRAGAKLTDALQLMDDTGEFRWRMENASRGSGGGFSPALKGWHDWLGARAYQQEQAAAQTVSTGMVLLNGASAALVAVVIFQSIAQISRVPMG